MTARTMWRLRGADFDVQLVVDTTAPEVVAAIEQAARQNGLELERVADDAGWVEPSEL